MPNRKWEIISSELVVESPWYNLRRDSCRLPHGSVIDQYYVRVHAGFSVVFALTPDQNVVMTRQYKHGIGDVVLELPAGALEAGESADDCAARELEEETGYVAPVFELMTEFAADPTSSTGRLFLFLAREATATGHPAPDSTEDIETVLLPISDVLARVRSGEIYVQSHVAAIYTALDRLGLVAIDPTAAGPRTT
ncbi:MAG TPA: NUDIX hydrolase [Candidatus Eremiobacteraceae bacterium]|nr:NUDIX hydrolase [Candidatus Eremiobacteraceae bacterium]